MRYIGGGHKKRYREIDFKREKHNVPAIVKAIEYDPNRSSRIALLFYTGWCKSYILAPEGLKVGQEIDFWGKRDSRIGNCLPLASIPLGTIIHNIELKPGTGAAMARSAGSYAQLLRGRESMLL